MKLYGLYKSERAQQEQNKVENCAYKLNVTTLHQGLLNMWSRRSDECRIRSSTGRNFSGNDSIHVGNISTTVWLIFCSVFGLRFSKHQRSYNISAVFRFAAVGRACCLKTQPTRERFRGWEKSALICANRRKRGTRVKSFKVAVRVRDWQLNSANRNMRTPLVLSPSSSKDSESSSSR